MSSSIKIIETKSNEKRQVFLEGPVSTSDPDLYDDVVSEKGQVSVNRQLNDRDITMDFDHDEWRDPKTGKMFDFKKNKIPVAMVVKSKNEAGGTFARVKMNMNHPFIDNIIITSN